MFRGMLVIGVWKGVILGGGDLYRKASVGTGSLLPALRVLQFGLLGMVPRPVGRRIFNQVVIYICT